MKFVRRGRARDGSQAGRKAAALAAAFVLGTMGRPAAQAPAVPPGLRARPEPPGTLRPLNFIAIPVAPAAPLEAASPAPVVQPAPVRPPVVIRAPRPVPVAVAADEAAVPLPIRRAVIHHLGGTAVVDALRAAGQLRRLADDVELRVVDSVPEVPSIRYFYAEDAGAARVTAVALEGSGRFVVRGFPEYRPRPRPGLIEVWLPPPNLTH